MCSTRLKINLSAFRMKICPLLLILVLAKHGECERTQLESLLEPFRILKLFETKILYESTRSTENARDLKTNKKLQDYINVPFPCSLNNTRSLKSPKTAHELRPGDIDVIGGMGDSLTAGFGLKAVNPLHVLLEDRGNSFSAGGQGSWRSSLTIPNILKVFNPNLFGYALGPSLTTQRTSQFNVAEGGAFSEEMPYMAKILVKRITKDPRVNLKKHWKMVNIFIGGNNFCADICWRQNSEDVLIDHRQDMLATLRTLRDNLPRTIVNLIPPPHMRILAGFTGKPDFCKLAHFAECYCIVGLAYAHRQRELYDIMSRWIEMDREIANLPEFDLDDFTVVYQPFVVNYTFPLNEKGFTDFSFMSADCFHFSQKGNARVANSLWNNFFEPVDTKSYDGVDIMAKFMCPTEQNPFIFTRRNSDVRN